MTNDFTEPTYAYEPGCIHGVSFFRSCSACGRDGAVEERCREAVARERERTAAAIKAALDVVREDDLINHVEGHEDDDDTTWAYERRKEAIGRLRDALALLEPEG